MGEVLVLSSPANASLLDIEVAEDGGVLIVRGELCLSTVEALRGPLFETIDSAAGRVIVDLADCTFIDSSGLEVLALASWRLAATHPRSELIVVSPRSAVRKILDLTGMDHILTLRDTRPTADGALQAERARALAKSLAAK
jgi:anti-sigma B factor antagonist